MGGTKGVVLFGPLRVSCVTHIWDGTRLFGILYGYFSRLFFHFKRGVTFELYQIVLFLTYYSTCCGRNDVELLNGSFTGLLEGLRFLLYPELLYPTHALVGKVIGGPFLVCLRRVLVCVGSILWTVWGVGTMKRVGRSTQTYSQSGVIGLDSTRSYGVFGLVGKGGILVFGRGCSLYHGFS